MDVKYHESAGGERKPVGVVEHNRFYYFDDYSFFWYSLNANAPLGNMANTIAEINPPPIVQSTAISFWVKLCLFRISYKYDATFLSSMRIPLSTADISLL